MVQARGDEQPLQKAVQEQADIAGRRKEAGKGSNGLLHRRPDKTGPKAQHRRQRCHAGKGPPLPGKHAAQDPFVGLFTGAVIHMGRQQAQQHAAEYAGIHGLDAQHAGLACTVQAGQAVRLRQQAQLGKGDIAGGEIDEVAHQRNERRLMLFLLCQRRRKPGAEQHAEVGDDRRQAFVKDPAHQPHRPPLQQRQRPGQRGAGEQGPCCQQQARRRKIGQRGQHRAGKPLQCGREPVFHGVSFLSGRRCGKVLSVVNRFLRKMSRMQSS